MAVLPENLLLDRPFKSLVHLPSSPLEALQRRVTDAWGQLVGGGGGDESRVEAAAGGCAAGAADRDPKASSSSSSSAAAAEAATPQVTSDHYTEADLTTARIKLIDFGRALPLDALDKPQGREPLLIFANPAYRAPEVPWLVGCWVSLVVGCGVLVLGSSCCSALDWQLLSLMSRPHIATPHHKSTYPFTKCTQEILGLEYRAAAYDMWSLGHCLYTLATGSNLFNPNPNWPGAEDDAGGSRGKKGGRKGGGRDGGEAEFDLNDSHLAQITGLLGRLPKEVRAWGRCGL